MAHALQMFFDAEAEAAVRLLWKRLTAVGVPVAHGRPHVTLAVAGTIPTATRQALRSELRFLSIPKLWLCTLGTVPADDTVLLLGAVVDTELLAVHSAVHDVLAGKVTNPSAYYFPGGWHPHCPLTRGLTTTQLTAGFAALQPPEPVRATVSGVGVVDTRTGEVDGLT